MNGIGLEQVTNFVYLGGRLNQDDNDTPCIEANISKARKQLGSIAGLLKREGANAVLMARFYSAVVQSILLYGADSWVISQRDLSKLRSFHLRAVRYITGELIRKTEDNVWVYPDHVKLLKKSRILCDFVFTLATQS